MLLRPRRASPCPEALVGLEGFNAEEEGTLGNELS
jgi:hypothetical protein